MGSEKKWKKYPEYNDRLHVLLPKGSKEGLRENIICRFGKDIPLNAYLKNLIELDLMGKVDWSDYSGDFDLLREVAATEKK